MVQAQATAKYVRTSAQKAGLVLDLIRGCDVNAALSTLRFSRKRVAKDIEKALQSAIANARQAEGFGGDVDRLCVTSCCADQGPSMKRVRPAPMGRAFRVVKRTAHLTVAVAERPARAVGTTGPAGTTKTAGTRAQAARRARTAAGARGAAARAKAE